MSKTHYGKHHRTYVGQTFEALLLGPVWLAAPAAVVLSILSSAAMVLLVLAIQSLI